MTPYRYMRAIVIFDLPVITKEERKLAAKFRKTLLDDGFECYNIQFILVYVQTETMRTFIFIAFSNKRQRLVLFA